MRFTLPAEGFDSLKVSQALCADLDNEGIGYMFLPIPMVSGTSYYFAYYGNMLLTRRQALGLIGLA